MSKHDDPVWPELAARLVEATADPQRWPGLLEACLSAMDAREPGGGGA